MEVESLAFYLCAVMFRGSKGDFVAAPLERETYGDVRVNIPVGAECGEEKMRAHGRCWFLSVQSTSYNNRVRLTVLSPLVLAACAPLFAGFQPAWNKPFPPHRVAENVYYVGTNYLASFLIVTPQGNILINPNFDESVPLIRASIEQLGFKFSDTKILLISHAHDDHCQGAALVKKMTGAKLMVMDRDVPEIEDGGKSDFHYPSQTWTPVKVDRTLHDGDAVELGGIRLFAHLTPGHTKGCTTWAFRTDGKNVVIVGSPNVNEGYKLVNNAKYPEIAADYRKMFRVLRSLPCDVFLGAHGAYYGLDEKYPKLKAGNADAFVDPDGYNRYVQSKQGEFEQKLKAQR